MPNHIHGIIKIVNNLERNEHHDTDVETLHATSLQYSNNDPDEIKKIKMVKISPKSGSLSTRWASFINYIK